MVASSFSGAKEVRKRAERIPKTSGLREGPIPARVHRFEKKDDKEDIADELHDPPRRVVPGSKDETEPEPDETRQREHREKSSPARASDLHAPIVPPRAERNPKEEGKNRGRNQDRTCRAFPR